MKKFYYIIIASSIMLLSVVFIAIYNIKTNSDNTNNSDGNINSDNANYSDDTINSDNANNFDTKYTVIWQNYNGTILETDSNVEFGTMPSYDGLTPTKDGNAQYSYTFDGWTPEITTVTDNQTYTAKFLESTNKYTIIWKNYDGIILETDKDVAYGTMPSYDGLTPTKDGNTQYSYIFDGWSPEISAVTDNKIYTAKFIESVNKYTVVWENYDGTILETDSNVEFGTMPSYDGLMPTKDGNAQYSYTFDGWSPEITTVTDNQTYTAKFLESTNKYTIIWKNYDGTILETDKDVAYGTMPSYDGSTPTKDGNSQYSYEFDGWSPQITKVTGNKTYTATFTSSVNYSSITISTSFLQMNVGDSHTFTFYYTPRNATGKVFLKTKNPEIISVGNYGKITVIGTGNAIVYAESENGLKSECTVVCRNIQDLKAPITINNWSNPSYFITETAELKEINLKFKQSTSKSFVYIQYDITALKTYCMYSGSYALKINYKLYNSKGVVVASGTITSSKFASGETVHITGEIYIGNELDGDEYSIKLSDVSW